MLIHKPTERYSLCINQQRKLEHTQNAPFTKKTKRARLGITVLATTTHKDILGVRGLSHSVLVCVALVADWCCAVVSECDV